MKLCDWNLTVGRLSASISISWRDSIACHMYRYLADIFSAIADVLQPWQRQACSHQTLFLVGKLVEKCPYSVYTKRRAWPVNGSSHRRRTRHTLRDVAVSQDFKKQLSQKAHLSRTGR